MSEDQTAESIAFNVELSLLHDASGDYKKKTNAKLDALEKDAKDAIEKGAAPKEFAKLSKLLHAIPAVKEIIKLYEPIN